MPSKEVRRIIDRVRKLPGWRVTHNKGHYRLYPADKTIPPITMASSPSDYRSIHRVRQDLRNAGVTDI